MVEYIEPIAATLFGIWTGRLWLNLREARAELAMANEKRIEAANEYFDTRRTLHALRSNCFITNERGHRVRYVNASVECRAVAEKLHAPE